MGFAEGVYRVELHLQAVQGLGFRGLVGLLSVSSIGILGYCPYSLTVG